MFQPGPLQQGGFGQGQVVVEHEPCWHEHDPPAGQTVQRANGHGSQRCPETGGYPTGDPSGLQEQDRADGGPGDGDHSGQRPQHQGDRPGCPEQESAFVAVGGAIHESVGHRGSESS